MMNLLKAIWAFIEEYFNTQYEIRPIEVPPEAQNAPVAVVTPKVEEIPVQPKYLWDTPTNVEHSVRVICDEEGLTVDQKNELCATVHCESNGFDTKAINKNILNGKVMSTDYGLCQWNDYYHGREISPEDALNNPEKAVRLMCKYWKQGLGRQWVCFSKGMYRQYLK